MSRDNAGEITMSWKDTLRKALGRKNFSKKEIQDIANENYDLADEDIRMEKDPSAIFPMECYQCGDDINSWVDGSKIQGKEICSRHIHEWVDKRVYESMTAQGLFGEEHATDTNIDYNKYRDEMGRLQ